MEENEQEGTIKIENKIIHGFVDIDGRKHKDCENVLIYYEDYDAYFCPQCNKWTESKCSDKKCSYCTKRPEKPL